MAKLVMAVPGEAAPSELRLEDKFPFPLENLSVGYVARAAEDAGFGCAIVDGYAERLTPEETAARVIAALEDGDVLGVSLMQSTSEAGKHLCNRVRAAGYSGPIAVGGWGPTMAPRESAGLIEAADWILRGEGEPAVGPLLRRLLEGTKEPVPGSLRRDPTGGLVPEGGAVPPVDFHRPAIPRHYAYESSNEAPSFASLPIQGSRGCAWGRCTFCSTAGRYGPGVWRFRCAESLLEELHHPAVDAAGGRIFFVDDEFFGPVEDGFARAKKLAHLILAEGLEVELGLDCLVPDFDPALFELLKRAGLRRVFLGIESGSNSDLGVFKKGFGVNQVRRTLAGLAALGIDVISGFILFQPYMSLDDVGRSVQFLLEDMGHTGNPGKMLSILEPEVGTEIFERLKSDGLLRGSYPSFSFAFADSRVGSLYKHVKEASTELRADYVRLRRTQTPLNDDAYIALNQRMRGLFTAEIERLRRAPVLSLAGSR